MTREWEDAVRRASIDDLQRLLASGADIDAKDAHGQTALMLAAHGGRPELVRWLIANGAALDHRAKYGLSAVMLAVVRGDGDCVRLLTEAGADLAVKGSGAPGFAGKTALDLAIARGDHEIAGVLAARGAPYDRLTSTPHFTAVADWRAAAALLAFAPLEPRHAGGRAVEALRVHVRDHQLRELPVGERSLEAHYGRFVFTQSEMGADEARRRVVDVRYGPQPVPAAIAGREARIYELGPEPMPDDIDGRQPAVIVWHDGGRFFLIASTEVAADVLLEVAGSVHQAGGGSAGSAGLRPVPPPPESS